MTNKWSFPVSKKMLTSCHSMGLVRMQKQWLVVHNCTRLGYQHKHQLTLLQPFLRSDWSVLQPVSVFSQFQDWGLSTKSSWPACFPQECKWKSSFPLTVKIQVPNSSLSFPAGDTSYQGLWTEQELDTWSWESRGLCSRALSPEMAVDTWSSRVDNELPGKRESK